MKAAPFEYCPVGSVEEAVALLAEDEGAKVLAGGQSLVPLMAMRLARPRRLVDLNLVPGLDGVRVEGDRLSLGAMVRHRQVERQAELRRRCPLIGEVVEQIGHVAIRNRGTVGGSLAHADPAAEWPALALALEAELVVEGGSGRRIVPAGEFFTGVFETVLRQDEVLTEVRFGLPSEGAGAAVLELSRRQGDFAIVGVVAVLEPDGEGVVREARLALFGVGETAVRARAAEARLIGERPDERVIAGVVEAVGSELRPTGDLQGSAEYRRHLAGVLTRRALVQAWQRAGRGA
jgi:carbon-monoxide dehydrogenase medium subunit